MNLQKSNKFFVRLESIFIIHFIFKIGDQSFNVFSDFTLRGTVFSLYIVIYWLCVWYIAAFFHRKIIRKQKDSILNKKLFTFLLFSFHFTFGFIASFFANWFYRLGDIYFFDMGEVWSSVWLLNPELTFSLLLIYMMVLSVDIYYNTSIKAKEDQLQLEKLKRENTLAQYLNLKSQIEPHFLFNSLSVLSSIVYSDVDLASEFILRLSKILRYVIEKNVFLLVPLDEEITFIENYLFLIQTRFEKGIIFENTIDKNMISSCYIPPASLQLLIENAIKHNKFTIDNPLRITLFNDDECLIVNNNVNTRNDIENSTNLGLDNLTKRYSHLSDKPVVIKKTDMDFTVSLPILTKEQYERFNI